MSDKVENNLISVIIPAYNIEAYVARCLQSILDQTYDNLEIIVIDDGSEDKTRIVAEEMARKDARIKVIHQENGGVSSARKHGIEISNGHWIGFVDGDDFIEPGMYQFLLQNALASDADISCCGYRKMFPEHVDLYFGTGKKLLLNRFRGIVELLGGDLEPGLCNKLYRKVLFQQLQGEQGLDCEIKNYEDLLLNYFLFSKAKTVVSEDVCLYNYIFRTGSASHPKYLDHKYRDPVKVWQILLQETEGDPELHGICLDKLAQHLTRSAMISSEEEKTRLKNPYKKEAGAMLSAMLPQLLRNDYCSLRTKTLAVMALKCPALYTLLKKAAKGS